MGDRLRWVGFGPHTLTPDVSKAGVILISPKGFHVLQVIRFLFRATNNEAEYEIKFAGLRLAKC